MSRWADIHWRAVAGLASVGAAILVLAVEGIRASRADLIVVAGACLLLGALAWMSRNRMQRSVT
jgi:hypothetical protein